MFQCKSKCNPNLPQFRARALRDVGSSETFLAMLHRSSLKISSDSKGVTFPPAEAIFADIDPLV